MFRIVLAMVVLVACMAVPSLSAAQSLFPQVSPSSAESETELGRIIEQATQNGLSVIVIDGDGNVLSDGESGEEGSDAPLQASGRSGLMGAQENANAFRDALVERLVNLPAAANEVLFILRATSPDGTLWAYGQVLIYSLMLFAAGMVAERYIYGKRIAARFIIPLIKDDPQGYSGKMPFLVIRFIGGLIGTLFAMAVAYVLGFVIFGTIEDSAIQYTATMINIGYFTARFITGLWRMILSPYLSQYRIPRLSDRDAKRLHWWLSLVAIAGVFFALFSVWITELGLNADLSVFITSLTSFLMMWLNILLILVNRRAITDAVLNGSSFELASFPVRMLARWWLPLVLVYVVFAWAELVYDLVLGLPQGVPLGPAAYLILTVVLVVYGVINFFIERSFARARAMRILNDIGDGELEVPDEDLPEVVQDALEVHRSQLNTFEDLARRVAGILAFVAGFWAFLQAWQPGTNMMSDSLTNRLMDVVVILFIGYIAYNAFRIWIDEKIRQEQGDEEPAELGDEGGGSSASRLATLLPLFRNLVLIVIVASVLLIVLMEMGVNVGPLFAGAGIVGVAVGFGSQTLVRDIFSGAFFLFDDAFRKGEYIEIGEVKGTVEKISVRSFQLRHHLGKLHTIPFGEIQVLSNYSRDWVMMKLPLRVTYDTDVEKVRKLIKKLGQNLLEDPEIGPDFIQPLKSQGVIEMQDSAMIIRVKFMTKPGDQWVIRKRVFQEIRDLFEREGIKFAHREVTVRLADEGAQKLDAKQKEAVMAAAEAAIDDDMLDGPEGRDDDR